MPGPLPITSFVETYETGCEVELWWLLLLVLSVNVTDSAREILLSGAWICQESFIGSWITPHVVKPFIKTSRFFFAFFVTYKKGNVRQLIHANPCVSCSTGTSRFNRHTHDLTVEDRKQELAIFSTTIIIQCLDASFAFA